MKDIESLFLLLLLLVLPVIATDDSLQTLQLEKELEALGAADLLIFDIIPVADSITDSTSLIDSTADSTAVASGRSMGGGPVGGGTVSSMGGSGRKKRAKKKAAAKEKVASTTEDTTAFTAISALEQATVDEVSTINVHEGHKTYRSPQKALLMSLVAPGWGQAYSKKYWKTGLFVLAEAGLIAGHFKYKADSKEKKDQAHAFVDKNFTTKDLKLFLNTLQGHGITTFGKELYTIDLILPNQSSIDEYIDGATGSLYEFAESPNNTQGWSDMAGSYKVVEGAFYINDAPLPINALRFDGDNPFGVSAQQQTYVTLLDESKEQDEFAQAFILGIVLNHVVSAADAFISAHAYNRKYMKNEETILSRISLDNSMELSYNGTPLTRVGLIWHF